MTSTPITAPRLRSPIDSPRAVVTSLVLAALWLMPAAHHRAVASEIPDGTRIDFNIVDLKADRIIATGYEDIRFDGDSYTKETVYFTVAEEEVQRDVVRYRSSDLKVSDYRADNVVTGERVRVDVRGDRIDIEYRERASQPAKKDLRLEWTPRTLFGKTLHHVIVRNWDRLMAGETVDFDLLIASKFDQYAFRLRRDREADGTQVIRLEPQAWVARAVVPALDFYYGPDRQAVAYEGPSTVTLADGAAENVRINFSYRQR